MAVTTSNIPDIIERQSGVEYSIARDSKYQHTMSTQSTNREWENAVIGTGLIASLGAILLGVFQLAEGVSVGVVPLCIGGIGALLLFFLPNWNKRRQVLRDRISPYISSPPDDDPRFTLRERYARGEIDDAEFTRRLRQLRASNTDDEDDLTTDQDIISRRN